MSNGLISGKQKELDLIPITEGEIDGIGMGVLSDGTPYLSARGLARLCGVVASGITTLTSSWESERLKPRGQKISALLREQGVNPDNLFIQVTINGTKTSAFNDVACMSVLEYYAFDSSSDNDTAIKNYRALARRSIREFIYTSLGYDPKSLIPDSWKHFHDRMLLNEIPRGYFSIFKEIADIIVSGIRHGLKIDSHVVPDISVGRFWSDYWSSNRLDSKHGERKKYPHSYPDYFPQAKSGPLLAYIYPLSALGEFRIWLEENYLPNKFQNYLENKSKQGFLPVSNIDLLMDAVSPLTIEHKK